MHVQTLETGAVVDRYTVEGVLGEGGMAIVYRVRHNALGTKYALKILTIGNRQVQERLEQEGAIQARLQHPNIVAVIDQIRVGGAPALVMEYVEGLPLDVLLRDHPPTLAQADVLARGILDGVAHAHAAGLIHRDLKPGNILLKATPDGLVPKVADFGLAKVTGEGSNTRTGSTMGTPHYMSPEQIRDAKHVGPESDVFALGAILYELVTHRRAFAGDDLLTIFTAVAAGTFTPPAELVPDLPERMTTAIGAALRVKPEDRPRSVAELKASWCAGVEHPAPPQWDAALLKPVVSLAKSRVPGVGAGSDTWTSQAPATPGTGSLDRPTPAVSSSPAVVAAGVGGVVLAGVGVGAGVLALALGVGAWWWSARTLPETPAPAPGGVSAVAAPAEPALATGPEVPPPSPDTPVGEAPAPGDPPRPTPRPGSPAPAGDGAAEVAPVEVPGEPAPEAAPTADPPAPVEPEPEPEPSAPAPAPAAPGEPEWTQFLASDDPAERRRGVTNLRNRTDEESILLLTRVLKEERDGDVRADAVRALVWRADERKGDYDLLMQGLALGAGGRDSEAIPCLQALGRNAERPEQLRRGLKHPSGRVRGAALDAAQAMSPRAPDGYDWGPLLQPLTTDADAAVAKKANQVAAALAP